MKPYVRKIILTALISKNNSELYDVMQ